MAPNAEEKEEATAEAAPKLSFAVDTSMDNGAGGKGESIEIDTAVDSKFVGGPRVPVEAKAPVQSRASGVLTCEMVWPTRTVRHVGY